VIAYVALTLGLVLAVSLAARPRDDDAPTIERRVRMGYGPGFKVIMVACLLAHTGFMVGAWYGTDDSERWVVWEFGGFALLAWGLVLEGFFTRGFHDERGVALCRFGLFESHLAWEDIRRVKESRARGVLVLEGEGAKVRVPLTWKRTAELRSLARVHAARNAKGQRAEMRRGGQRGT